MSSFVIVHKFVDKHQDQLPVTIVDLQNRHPQSYVRITKHPIRHFAFQTLKQFLFFILAQTTNVLKK